jgi:hypothetical protein
MKAVSVLALATSAAAFTAGPSARSQTSLSESKVRTANRFLNSII